MQRTRKVPIFAPAAAGQVHTHSATLRVYPNFPGCTRGAVRCVSCSLAVMKEQETTMSTVSRHVWIQTDAPHQPSYAYQDLAHNIGLWRGQLRWRGKRGLKSPVTTVLYLFIYWVTNCRSSKWKGSSWKGTVYLNLCTDGHYIID